MHIDVLGQMRREFHERNVRAWLYHAACEMMFGKP